MKQQVGRRKRALESDAPASSGLDPTWLAGATSDQLGEAFRRITTLPLEQIMNAGGHQVDVAARTIFNDEYYKGWLPKETALPIRDIFARLSTGYANRFWKQGQRYLGETLYLDGRIRVKHSLEEFTTDRPLNDLDPGRYILLRYTDAIFDNLFYDVMKAGNDGVIVYGGYTGRFPEGRRGFNGVLMRRYSFAELGERDHQVLFQNGARVASDSLKGTWRLSVIATSNHATPVGEIGFARRAGTTAIRCEPVLKPEVLVPSFVTDHFTMDTAAPLEKELRRVDARTIVGRWSADIGPLYARFLATSPGLFHRETERGKKRYILKYVLTPSPRSPAPPPLTEA
jgi:hypothetical protein